MVDASALRADEALASWRFESSPRHSQTRTENRSGIDFDGEVVKV